MKSVVKFVKENWRVILAIVVTVVVTVVTAGMMSAQAACYSSMAGTAAMSAGGFAAIGGAFIGGFAGGLISTGSLKGALMGGLTAAAFAGVGAGFSKLAAGNAMNGVTGVFTQGAFKGLTGIQAFGQSISHGLVGGLSSKLSGGSFSKGALISFLNKGASRAVSSVNLFVSTVKHAIFGGAISKYIAGGSFSAGARLAAMATFFNDGGGDPRRLVDGLKRVGEWFKNNFRVGIGGRFGVGPVRADVDFGSSRISDINVDVEKGITSDRLERGLGALGFGPTEFSEDGGYTWNHSEYSAHNWNAANNQLTINVSFGVLLMLDTDVVFSLDYDFENNYHHRF